MFHDIQTGRVRRCYTDPGIMSTTSTDASEASAPAPSSSAKLCKSTNELTETTRGDVHDDREGSYDNYCNDSPSSRSRYGRTIKLKSPQSDIANSPHVCSTFIASFFVFRQIFLYDAAIMVLIICISHFINEILSYTTSII